MKVILRENIENLGRVGDIIKVSDGYARNFLLPRKLVFVADENNIKAMEHHQKSLSRKREHEKTQAIELAKKIEAFSCTIVCKVGENEKLFGSVTATDIAHALAKGGFEIERGQVLLKEPIKQLGVFTAGVKLEPNVTAQIKISVVKEAPLSE